MSLNSMRKYSAKTISTLIRYSILQAIAIAIFIAVLLSFIYGVVYHYQQQRLHAQQLVELLANSAASVDGASLVAKQVKIILNDDPTLESILFYATDHPAADLQQAATQQHRNDWYNALFADSVSFNRAVISQDITRKSTSRIDSDQQLTTALAATTFNSDSSNNIIAEQDALIGYINITLDMQKLRWQWFYKNIFLWLITVILGTISATFVLRKLSWPLQDTAALAKVCKIAIDSPELKQLPVIHQHFDFQELSNIRLAFISLFGRLKTTQQKIDSLATFEQQLHNKDLSLDIQRRNFQSMITHELKTSLNAISGGLQLLDKQYLNEEQKDTLAIIHKGGQHLDATLEQIIQLNKIEQGQVGISFSTFKLLDLLSDLLTEFQTPAKKKGLELSSRIQHADYTLEGDVNKIKKILSTLIENALKFTLAGQVIVESQLTHFNESIRWQIKVIDTGIGIDSKYLDDIFSPFFQVDPSYTQEYEGVGVGLAVVNQIVQLLDAAIEVSSELGVGSEFTLLMPLHHTYQAQRPFSLVGINIIYYHHYDTGFMVEALQDLGATLSCQQYELLVLGELASTVVDIVMIAEDILPAKAAQLARRIRAQESSHRSLLIYWYPNYKIKSLQSIEYNLKAVGVDYCHSATQDKQLLQDLLQQWLA
jgi:signal transduction histidine kinase